MTSTGQLLAFKKQQQLTQHKRNVLFFIICSLYLQVEDWVMQMCAWSGCWWGSQSGSWGTCGPASGPPPVSPARRCVPVCSPACTEAWWWSAAPSEGGLLRVRQLEDEKTHWNLNRVRTRLKFLKKWKLKKWITDRITPVTWNSCFSWRPCESLTRHGAAGSVVLNSVGWGSWLKVLPLHDAKFVLLLFQPGLTAEPVFTPHWARVDFQARRVTRRLVTPHGRHFFKPGRTAKTSYLIKKYSEPERSFTTDCIDDIMEQRLILCVSLI